MIKITNKTPSENSKNNIKPTANKKKKGMRKEYRQTFPNNKSMMK